MSEPRRIYLSPKGLADVKRRSSPEDQKRLDQLVKEGRITIVGGNGKAETEETPSPNVIQ